MTFPRIYLPPALLLMFALAAVCAAQNAVQHGQWAQRATAPSQSAPIVSVSPGNWSQLAQLSATGLYSDLGAPVAISGDTVVIAQPPNVGQNSTVASVFVKGTNGWRASAPVATLSAPISLEAYLAAVAIDGDTIVVTGPVDWDGFAGYAFVYVKPPGGWQNMGPTATLTAPDAGVTAFGQSVSISGDTIVVGDEGNPGETTGAAYVYVKPASGWQNMTETAVLTASDANVNDNFGESIAISGGTIAVGATQLGPLGMGGPGKAYVFVEPSSGWASMTQTAELTVADASGVDEIGFSVATDGNSVIVGAPSYNDFFGAVFVYSKPETGWANMTESATLNVGDGLAGGLGNSVALSGKIAIAGASFRGFPPNGVEGGVYVFEEPSSGWQNASSNIVLTGSDAHYGAEFGESVAISGKTLVGGSFLFLTPSTAFVFGLP